MPNPLTTAIRAIFRAVTPLETSKVPEPPKDNVATYEKALLGLGPRYNPDQLAGRNGLKIYDKMRLDEQVKAVMNFKRDAITARGWTFKYEDYSSLSDTERQKRIRIFTDIVNGMRGSFIDAMNVMATGRDYGFSMSEKIYSDITIDKQTYVGISEIRGRDPSSFEFYTDEFGTLLRVDQVVPGRRITIDLTRMIYYVHSPEFDRFFGRSDLREAYRAWFIKQRVGELWALYLERMAGGFVVINPKDTGDPAPEGTAAAQSIHNVLANLHSASGIKMPPGYDVEVISPASTDAYEKAMVFWDLAIAKALLVPNLLGISHTGQTGAFSQSQTQLEAFFWTLNADSERLEACINEQLIKDLGDQNFGDGDYPYFAFKPASREYITKTIADWKVLVDAGSVVVSEADEEHFRKLLDMPKRDEKTDPLIDPVVQGQEDRATQGQQFDQKMQTNADKRAQAEADRAAKEAQRQQLSAMQEQLVHIKTVLERLQPDGNTHTHHSPNGAAPSGSQAVPHGSLKMASRAQFDNAVRRVAFTVIESRQDRIAVDTTAQVAAFIAKAAKRMLGADADLAKLIDNDPTDIASVEMTSNQKSRLKDMYRRSLATAWTLGGSLARNELERARGQRFVAMTDLRDKAADYFEANGFRMAGNVADGVRALIQQELQNSVKFGRSVKDTREVIWDRLVSRGFTTREAALESEDDPLVVRALKELWGVSAQQTAAYLDTLARTNLYEAMNEARFAEFTDPSLGDFVVALEYSAILDDRTTDICETLNGSVYAADSEQWDNIRPPNHYNCRSVLIPITAIDGWDGRESPAPTVQPQKGFGATLQ